MAMQLSQLEQNIINRYQKGFPLCSHPYRAIADELNSSEDDVISAILTLNKAGMLSRVGAVFNHKKAGSSTLAALAVPEHELDDMAEIVNQFEQVNHNYGREHHYNLWFVVTAHDDQALTDVINSIERLTGYQVLVLPMEASYHIDLAFKINFAESAKGKH
jgi:siroheme decarboxylase|tara:strand:+ start:2016 stop:2498 length:483 start_codon:yes stop_codon:yes gene_type:complete